MAKLDDLLRRAKQLGVPTNSGVYKPTTEAWTEVAITEYELARRIGEEGDALDRPDYFCHPCRNRSA